MPIIIIIICKLNPVPVVVRAPDTNSLQDSVAYSKGGAFGGYGTVLGPYRIVYRYLSYELLNVPL